MAEPQSIVAMSLDQSPTATGWAIGGPCEARPKFGLFNMPSWGDDEGERLWEFEKWLTEKIVSSGVTCLFYEAPVQVKPKLIYKNGKAVLINIKDFDIVIQQIEQIGIIHLVARKCSIPIEQVVVASWRLRFLGTAKDRPGLFGKDARDEWKRMAVKACVLRGWYVDDDNVAEALGILDFGLSTLSHKHAGSRDPLFSRAQQNHDVAKFRGEA